jgi:hypothetical protein
LGYVAARQEVWPVIQDALIVLVPIVLGVLSRTVRAMVRQIFTHPRDRSVILRDEVTGEVTVEVCPPDTSAYAGTRG